MIYVLSGGAKAFAVIGVTYPAGSVCTCTDGTKTLTLKDTGGQGFFLIPHAAAWTVTATDGTNTKAQSVEITSEGQSESVELNYSVEIFNGGAIVPFTTIEKPHGKVTVGETILFEIGESAFSNMPTKNRFLPVASRTYFCTVFVSFTAVTMSLGLMLMPRILGSINE